MVIVLISGKQGAGKSTLAKAIQDHFHAQQKQVFTLRFAEPLYQMHTLVRSVLRTYRYEEYDYEKKDGNLLQLLGTEWGRAMDSQIWVKLLLNSIRSLPADSIVTVEDCRFENEFDAFETVPSVLRVRLEASRQIRKVRASMWRENESHPSEVGLDHYAAMGRFNLVLDANKNTKEEILSRVIDGVNVLLQGFNRNEGMGQM